MATKKKSSGGLQFRKGVWHIDKRIRGRRLCESTGTSNREEAEQYLARRMEELRQADVYGVRPARTWRQAATRYLNEYAHKRSISRDAQDLRLLDEYIGGLELRHIHDGTLARFIADRRKQGIKSSTVERSLAVVRRILRLCAELWRDEHGMTWLESAPMIRTVNWDDRRKPWPLSWEEQDLLFARLPEHLRRICTFAVNTGCREQEACQLRWEWERKLPIDGEIRSVFILPAELTKNGRARVVVLNAEAREVIEAQRGEHPERVFTYRGSPLESIDNSAWRRVRRKVGLEKVRVHDLRHTFGRRLRVAGVALETRQELLGHASGSITTHYSAAEVRELLEAVERIGGTRGREDGNVTVLELYRSRKTHAQETTKAAS